MRPIDAKNLKEEIMHTYEYEFPTASGAFDEFVTKMIPNIIDDQPSVDPSSVYHTYLICLDDDYWHCCSCGARIESDEFSEEEVIKKQHYCYNCGVMICKGNYDNDKSNKH